MLAVVREVNAVLQGAHFIQMQEIAPYNWVLFFDKAKLIVALKGPFTRFHLTRLGFRGKPAILTRHLAGQKFISATLVNQDRILALKFSGGELLIFEFIPGGKLLLVQEYTPKVCNFEHHVITSTITSQELEEKTLKAMELQWQEEWHKKNEKKIFRLKQDIEEGKQWSQTVHEAELLQAYFFKLKKGMTEVEIEDWEKEGDIIRISLDSTRDPQEELQNRFKKGRKLKKKLEIAEKLLKKAQAEAPPPFPLPIQKASTVPIKEHPYREFQTKSGLKIYVGKKDRDNDQLTFSFARGSDYWFHAANVAGSHVILKVNKAEEPDEEAIQDALQLALYYSKARGMHEDVIMAQAKYLSKPKGAKPGLVNVSKHKKCAVRPNPERLAHLLGKQG